MRQKILHKAQEMFLNFGFKSVTMDAIAKELAISKKTIYTHFKNKTTLVAATTTRVFELISNGIDKICVLEKNPIEELYAIKEFIMKQLKNEKTSPQYQLQKFYPDLYHTLKMLQFEKMQECVLNNLQRGIQLKLFRSNLDTNFITRIYFTGVIGIKDEETFPHTEFTPNDLLENFLEYHIRAIATDKGIQKLEKLLQKK